MCLITQPRTQHHHVLPRLFEMLAQTASERKAAMARNPVQFQKGMSLVEFLVGYCSEEQCGQAVIAWRWLDGFICSLPVSCPLNSYRCCGMPMVIQ